MSTNDQLNHTFAVTSPNSPYKNGASQFSFPAPGKETIASPRLIPTKDSESNIVCLIASKLKEQNKKDQSYY